MKRQPVSLFAGLMLGVTASSLAIGSQSVVASNRAVQRAPYVKRVSFDNVSFSYGSSLAATVTGHQVGAVDTVNGHYPRSVQFTFGGYIVPQYSQDTRVTIYPLDSGTGQASGPPQAAESQLRSILQRRPTLAELKQLPLIALDGAGEVFHAKEAYLTFQNGVGISYISAFAQTASPVTNQSPVVYVFQGITNDGKAYVSIQLPLFVAVLPNTAPSFSPAQFTTYLRNLTRTLNRLPDDGYTPHLNYLRTLAQSVSAAPSFAAPATVTLCVAAQSQGHAGANLRAQPNTQSSLMTLIPDGASVEATTPPVQGSDGKLWYEVTYKGQQGYVLASLVRRQGS